MTTLVEVKTIPVLVVAVLLSTAAPVAAQASPETAPLQAASRNVEVRHQVPDTKDAISINWLGDVMVLSLKSGLKTYDVSDPDRPILLDHLKAAEFALPGEEVKEFWENEDVNVDTRRKLVFMSRDFGMGTPDRSGVYVVSAANPRDLKILTFARTKVGHTTTCVADCDFLWSAGFDSDSEDGKAAGHIVATDLRDPLHPKPSPVAIDLYRNQGRSGITHDVQVDAAGVAWVAGTGGTRGYWTDGWRRDPVTGKHRRATPTEPVPFAGGGVPGRDVPTAFTHNSYRPVGKKVVDGPKPTPEHPAGSLLVHNEESFDNATCSKEGKLVISSLKGSYDGESWRATPGKPFEMKTVGTWTPDDQEGTTPEPKTMCSAHYFDVKGQILAMSFYGQGTRFIDISNPKHPIQIAYHRPEKSFSFAPYWHKGRVYVADWNHGVMIMKLTKGAHDAQASGAEVTLRTNPAKARVSKGIVPASPHPVFGHACAVFSTRGCRPGACC